MTLMNAIIRKVKSSDCLGGKCASPPPEIETIEEIEKKIKKKRKRRPYLYSHVLAKVDTSPPPLDFQMIGGKLQAWRNDLKTIYEENLQLIMAIKTAYNKRESKLPTVQELERDWKHNRREIIRKSLSKFVLFSPTPIEDVEDPAFLPPKGFKRPRVYMTLKLKRHSHIGDLLIELFTDVCPLTCKLFMELFDGGDSGYSYVGTQFFRKVPNLYWSGGDVVFDNGFGCYAQEGRRIPIGAENFHFSHSIPGLLSMRVTRNDEVCGIFNITFKAIPQLDLRNVVFGRVVRPSATLNNMAGLGAPLSSVPVVEIAATRHHRFNKKKCGLPNTRLEPVRPNLKTQEENEGKTF